MIQLIGILLCVYLVFKGFEILQIAICSRDAPTSARIIGTIAVIAAFIIASLSAQAFLEAGSNLPRVP